MAAPVTWQSAFVAMTFALGDSVEDANASLTQADAAVARTTSAGLAHRERDVRARTLAAVLGRTAADLEAARLV